MCKQFFYCGLVAMISLAFVGCRTGKRTFQAQRIDSADECVAGVPTQVMTLHKVQVQWMRGQGSQGWIDEQGRVGAADREQGIVQSASHRQQLPIAAGTSPVQVTTHFCRLPIVYGVDAIGTPFGTDEAKLEFYDDGTLKKAEEKRDHQIDELISSVTEAADELIPVLESSFGGSNPYDFFPPLPADAQIIEILQITPLQ